MQITQQNIKALYRYPNGTHPRNHTQYIVVIILEEAVLYQDYEISFKNEKHTFKICSVCAQNSTSIYGPEQVLGFHSGKPTTSLRGVLTAATDSPGCSLLSHRGLLQSVYTERHSNINMPVFKTNSRC